MFTVVWLSVMSSYLQFICWCHIIISASSNLLIPSTIKQEMPLRFGCLWLTLWQVPTSSLHFLPILCKVSLDGWLHNKHKHILKAEVCSLLLLSSGKNSITTFQHFVIQLVWRDTRLLHLSLALYLALENEDIDRHFLPVTGRFREHVPIGCPRVCFLAADGITKSWLAVKTSDVPYALKLASRNLTSRVAGDTFSQIESS